MPYYTESYIDPDDHAKYLFYSNEAYELDEYYYKPITRLKKPFNKTDDEFTYSTNEGGYFDIYKTNAIRLTGLLRDMLRKYDTFLIELASCIGEAQRLANFYEVSRHRTRQVYYSDGSRS